MAVTPFNPPYLKSPTYTHATRYNGSVKINFVCQGFLKLCYYSLRMRAFSYADHFRSLHKDGSHTIRYLIYQAALQVVIDMKTYCN